MIVLRVAGMPDQNVIGPQHFDSFVVTAFDGVEQLVRHGVGIRVHGPSS